MYNSSFNRIIISRAALANNFTVMKSCLTSGVELMAMVKADGYGHGMVEAARTFRDAGCRLFGVAELREGVALRQSGIEEEIFVTIGFAPEAAGVFIDCDLTPVIYDLESARALSAAALARKKVVAVHVKLETGMGRLGILPEAVPAFMAELNRMPGLRIAGVMSHFPETDNPEAPSTVEGLETFLRLCKDLPEKSGVVRHIANSGGVIHCTESHGDMARSGISLYGYHPNGRDSAAPLGSGRLYPAMRFQTRVLQVKEVSSGFGIGYGHAYTTTRPSRIAVLPVGYEDGYPRSLSNRGWVLVRGKRAPIRGRICMNMCMVDVTDIPEAVAGDEAVLLGRQGTEEITADTLANLAGSISYELLCSLGSSNQREYTDERQ